MALLTAGETTATARELPIGSRTITTRGNSVCGLRLDGSMLCWGDDTHGQLSVPPGAGFTAVAGGVDFNCALGSVGTPSCWGIDIEG